MTKPKISILLAAYKSKELLRKVFIPSLANSSVIDRNSNKPYQIFVDKWRKRGYNNAEHPAYWHTKLINFCDKVV